MVSSCSGRHCLPARRKQLKATLGWASVVGSAGVAMGGRALFCISVGLAKSVSVL